MNGMNPDPMKSSALQDRLICDKCGVSPKIRNPERITAEDAMLTITVDCHGESETKVIEKNKLIRSLVFFEQPSEN